MARSDYYAITTPTLQATSQAIRSVNGTVGTIAPEDYPDLISAMHSQSDYDNVMAQLIEETASGAVVSFADGANNIPVKELIASIEISGRTSSTLTHTGKNLCQIPSWTGHSGTVYFTGGYSIPANVTFTFSALVERDGTFTDRFVVIFRFADGTASEWTYVTPNSGIRRAFSKTYTKEIIGLQFYCREGYTPSQQAIGTISEIQIESGSSATAYEPYVTPVTHTIDFGQIVNGGELIIAEGEYDKIVTSDTPQETIVLPTKTEVKTLLGGNTFFADSGDVEVTYRANGALYVAQH